MKSQKIVKVVDAFSNQARAIIWLECHHKVSITLAQAATLPRGYIQSLRPGGKLDCPFCPDPPPEVVRQEKSARELYKEAGEP